MEKGVYFEKISPKSKRKLIGKLRSKMAKMIEKSDKEHNQAAKDIMWLRLYRA